MFGEVIQRDISRFKNPRNIVNLCFIVVFIFSTVLTWREAVVLEGAYVANQRNSLDNVATLLDRQLQHNIDNLLFYRNTMFYALQSPISTDRTRKSLAEFDLLRTEAFWQLRLDLNRSLPVNGVSDEFVNSNPLLDRNDETVHTELSSALELSYIMRLSDRSRLLPQRIFYASRSGFFLTNTPSTNDPKIISLYQRLISQPYFSSQSPQNNPSRALRWTHTFDANSTTGQIITAAIPLDFNGRWYGILAFDYPIDSLHDFLQQAKYDDHEGTVLLYDNELNPIATSAQQLPKHELFTAPQLAQIASVVTAAKPGEQGELRMDSRFITWAKLNNFDGLLVKVHTLEEGVQGEFGRISIVLSVLWMLFTLMLVVSWIVIRRLVNNMFSLQKTLTWRANYDTLTRLYNRGAFFEIAQKLSQECKLQAQPFSVIQMDLDLFKSINDRFGHNSGDKVLAHAAAMLSDAFRQGDVAGRVGGEEFCIVLPDTTLEEAVKVAERIRVRINTKDLLLKQGNTTRISASFGVSSAQEFNDYDFERLQSHADHRLYKAKQDGRNRVCSHD
ncbi:cellulose biosynthesis regulator diguanylate cyclase DgcQ [Buttiauxella sp. WJP83]|uniref:cellulose biosynthesis regulator diguanylate cyclase DgcQ n=1 Tax=Buttiauxella sp. WJP83 TaxID=2986951 RepID=UPI0022DDDF1C|nr:cellulose biosynthesis regulator diguanylate cyclase DgcQ [Buttiauxella sp. WJP83]WBM72150.1 cellulose biosynthesis regulator diguanylate cyclase DgcQ [Buttiauxella sp. WJP83]